MIHPCIHIVEVVLEWERVCSVSWIGGGIGLVVVWAVGSGVVCHALEKVTLYSQGMLCTWLIVLCI